MKGRRHDKPLLRTFALLAFAAAFLSALNSPGQPNCLPPPTGLVAWWPAEGTPLDVVGTNHGIELNGVAYTNGMVGKAFYFEGNSSYIVVQPNTALQFSNEFTIELWYKAERTNGLEGLVSTRNSESAGFNYDISITPGELVRILFDDPAVSGGSDVGTPFEISQYVPGPPAGDFHHLAVSYQQIAPTTVEVKTYLDGQLVRVRTFTASLSRSVNPAARFFIGASADYNNTVAEAFQGIIDEVSLYNRALSIGEIQSVYNAGSSGKCDTSPPSIWVQPADQTVFIGKQAGFRVVATGAPVLAYQWTFKGTNIANATTSILNLTNIQFSQGGAYAVRITNSFGFTNSSNALLTVLAPPPCSTPGSNLISWWRAESNTLDQVTGNTGTLQGDADFGPGQAGAGFVLDGNGDAITLSNPPTLQVQNFTIEGWIKRASTLAVSSGTADGMLFSYGLNGYGFGIHPGGQLFLAKMSVDSVTAAPAITDTDFHHVAVTKAATNVVFYVDGIAYPVPGYGSTFTFTTSAAIGARGDNLASSFLGMIDELSIYSRALSSVEMQAIFLAGISDKCLSTVGPTIIIHPTNRTVTAGTNITFNVAAAGSAALKYQWRFNGTNIAGATTNLLTLTNVLLSYAGNYSVVVTNSAGLTISSNALLTVNIPPATVRALSTNITGGASVVVPITIVANGNENVLGFSLNFETNKLIFLSASLGPGAPAAVLMANTSQTNIGRLGLGIIMPTDATFAPGTQTVAFVSFLATNVAVSTTATNSFGDLPTPRQLLDTGLNSLSATYSNGTVSISVAPAYEGDVFSRPNGDRTVTLTDWLLLGRYTARLDYPTNAAEFQRADCAPRLTLGDAAIKVTDWVQAGRYSSGLDLVQPSGGPTNESASPAPSPSASRLLIASGTSLLPNETATISVTLAAQSNENAVAFSLSFDPSLVALIGAAPGTAAGGATLFVNTSQAGSGRVGVALALGTLGTFAPGDRELIRLTFRASSFAHGSFVPAFTDQPVPREISDFTASPLPVGFSAGTFTVNPPPALRITRADQNTVLLAWPMHASNYVVQQAVGSLAPSIIWSNLPSTLTFSNSECTLLLPATNSPRFYRLKSP
jgi:hypothetical protein